MRPDLEELSQRQWSNPFWLDHHHNNDSSKFRRLGRNQSFAKHLLSEAGLTAGKDYLIINETNRIGISLSLEHENLSSWILLSWPRYKDATIT